MKLLDKKAVLSTKPFAVEELQLARDGEPLDHPYYRLSTNDWVNILPILSDGRALLIRQFRAGALRPILEVPGGMMDAGEKDAMMAALRELEEETGYTSQRVLPLGSLNPNPAIMSNRTHFFLALAATPNPSRKHFPDTEERIELELVPAIDLDLMVRTGQIDHALAALCIMLAGKYIDVGMKR